MMSRDDGIGQHVRPANISGPQESKSGIIYFLGNNGMGSVIQKIR